MDRGLMSQEESVGCNDCAGATRAFLARANIRMRRGKYGDL